MPKKIKIWILEIFKRSTYANQPIILAMPAIPNHPDVTMVMVMATMVLQLPAGAIAIIASVFTPI